MAGFVEVLILTSRATIGQDVVWAIRDYPWMTPLSWLAHFIPLILVAALAMAIFPHRRVWSVSLAGFGTVAAFGLLSIFLYPKLHNAAVFLLALGIGVQAARLGTPRKQAIARKARWAVLALTIVTFTLTTSSLLWHPAKERRLLAQLPQPQGERPNVLIIILDTVRAASLSLYGYSRATTPHLEEWATRGVIFDDAWSTAPWTLPSHGTMFTGRYPFEFRGDWDTGFDREVPTLAERFRDEGYRTGGFVANLYYAAWDSGLDRGFIHYEDYLRTPQQLLFSSSIGQAFERVRRGRHPVRPLNVRRYGPFVTRPFFQWLDETAPSGRPFFVFLNYFAAHKPFFSPKPFNQMFLGDDNTVDRYDGAIAYLDNELDKLFSDLEARGVLDNTLVVVTSDHGEFMGEHGLQDHGNALYPPVLHVPLVIIPQRGEQMAVRRVAEPVSLRDLAATVQQVAGLPVTLPGQPLRGLWQHDSVDVSLTLAQVSKGIRTPPDDPLSLGPMYTVRAGPWHFILNGDCREEVYDLSVDPLEEHNLRDRLSVDSLSELRDKLYAAIPAVREGPCNPEAP